MPQGDFNWASREIGRDLGPRWRSDKMGHVLLDNALYRRMSPDLHYKYYYAFLRYMRTNYRYDFEDMFDWEAYRRHYRGNQ